MDDPPDQEHYGIQIRSHDDANKAGTMQLLSGSASVSLAVFGLWPKTSVPCENPPNGAPDVWLAGGTPARATETVALPV